MELIYIFVAQIVCSLTRTLSINALVSRHIGRAIVVTALSDFILLSSWVNIMRATLSGATVAVIIAVAGSAVGNLLAMIIKRKVKR